MGGINNVEESIKRCEWNESVLEATGQRRNSVQPEELTLKHVVFNSRVSAFCRWISSPEEVPYALH